MFVMVVVMVHENDWIPFDMEENVVVGQENLIVVEVKVDYYRIIVVDGNFRDYHVLMNEDLYIDLNPIVILAEILYLTTQKKTKKFESKHRLKHTENGSLPSIGGSR